MSAGGHEKTEPVALTIGDAAAEAGVTVRTLHHWDAIGLVTPTSRTVGGYRLYSASDLRRIRRVLRYQALGLPLAAYFDGTHSMHVLLGRMYVADEEFAAYYNAICPGLAAWLRAAIDANAAAYGVDPATATWA